MKLPIKGIKNKTILEEIYVLKGIAIIGLIIIHLNPPLINLSISRLLVLKIIGTFAMPMFIFASGFLYGLSRLEVTSFADYISFVAKKFKRLMVPYLVMSCLILVLKYFATKLVSIQYMVDKDFWKYMLFNPVKGFAAFLWYLYVLYFVFLIFPILKKLVRNSFVLFLLILSIYLIPIPQTFYFNHGLIRGFLIYFCLGYLFSYCKFEIINVYIHYLFILFLGLLVILSVKRESIADVLNIFMNHDVVNKVFKIIMVSVGVLTYYYLSLLIKRYENLLFHLLRYIGVYSASIYLFHTISIGIVRIFFIDILGMKENLFALISVFGFICGIVFPILITKYFLNKFEILPNLILGVKKTP
jgi:fucose 4-O-acetylase-like acetyltransferase